MLENYVSKSYLFLLFSGRSPTFSYFLMKIPTFSYFFDVSYYLTPCLKFLCPDHLWMQQVETNSFAQGRAWVSPLPHGISTTKPAFIEWQSTTTFQHFGAESQKPPLRWL